MSALALFGACETEQRAVATFPRLVRLASSTTGTSPAVIANDQPDDGQWVRAAKDYSSSRFSKLDQIERIQRWPVDGSLELLDERGTGP